MNVGTCFADKFYMPVAHSLFNLQTDIYSMMKRCAECGFMDGEIRVDAKPCQSCKSKFSSSSNISAPSKTSNSQNVKTAERHVNGSPSNHRRKQTPKSTKVSILSSYFLCTIYIMLPPIYRVICRIMGVVCSQLMRAQIYGLESH